MGRRYRGSIDVAVDLDDVVRELSDKDIREEFEERFGSKAASEVDFDLLAEVRLELCGGRANSALALIESALLARRVTDAAKADAYDATARAH